MPRLQVTINGLSVGFDLEHLARYVCVAYTGRDRCGSRGAGGVCKQTPGAGSCLRAPPV